MVKSRTTSQFVETTMSQTKVHGIRDAHPFAMLAQSVEVAGAVLIRHHEAAESCSTDAPPKVMKMLEVLLQKDRQRPARIEWVGAPPSRVTRGVTLMANVYPNAASASYHRVVLEVGRVGQNTTCTCGLTALTRFPCVHMVCVALKAGILEKLPKPAGRPQKKRRRGALERNSPGGASASDSPAGPARKKGARTCSKCGGVGHYAKTCKGRHSILG